MSKEIIESVEQLNECREGAYGIVRKDATHIFACKRVWNTIFSRWEFLTNTNGGITLDLTDTLVLENLIGGTIERFDTTHNTDSIQKFLSVCVADVSKQKSLAEEFIDHVVSLSDTEMVNMGWDSTSNADILLRQPPACHLFARPRKVSLWFVENPVVILSKKQGSDKWAYIREKHMDLIEFSAQDIKNHFDFTMLRTMTLSGLPVEF